jgi:hypothetical protein
MRRAQALAFSRQSGQILAYDGYTGPGISGTLD